MNIAHYANGSVGRYLNADHLDQRSLLAAASRHASPALQANSKPLWRHRLREAHEPGHLGMPTESAPITHLLQANA